MGPPEFDRGSEPAGDDKREMQAEQNTSGIRRAQDKYTVRQLRFESYEENRSRRGSRYILGETRRSFFIYS